MTVDRRSGNDRTSEVVHHIYPPKPRYHHPLRRSPISLHLYRRCRAHPWDLLRQLVLATPPIRMRLNTTGSRTSSRPMRLRHQSLRDEKGEEDLGRKCSVVLIEFANYYCMIELAALATHTLVSNPGFGSKGLSCCFNCNASQEMTTRAHRLTAPSEPSMTTRIWLYTSTYESETTVFVLSARSHIGPARATTIVYL